MKRKEYLNLDAGTKSFLTQEMHRFIAMVDSVDRLTAISKSLPKNTRIYQARPAIVFEGHEIVPEAPAVNATEFLGRIIYRLQHEIDFMDTGGWLQEIITIMRTKDKEEEVW